MDHVESLVRWIITYSVSGGFMHFLGCFFIILAITRVFRLVNVSMKTPSAKSDEG